jgi:hypothetical protein
MGYFLSDRQIKERSYLGAEPSGLLNSNDWVITENKNI